jgi:polyhydroxybutyrate depolymerase
VRKALSTVLLGIAMTACSSSTTSTATTTTTTTATTSTAATPQTKESPTTESAPAVAAVGSTVDSVNGRPFTVVAPESYKPSVPAPLIVALHGYTSSGAQAQQFFGLQARAEKAGFVAVYPDGTKDGGGEPFWNATDACCNFALLSINDSAYLMAVIERVSRGYAIDPKRVYVIGHSNGGFMSYRMACEHADKIAAIVSVAGETYADSATCNPSEPVSVLQIQGSADETISYTGGKIFQSSYPGAEDSAKTWAMYNGCQTTTLATKERRIDLVASLAGEETDMRAYACPSTGGAVELWTINEGRHSPTFTEEFAAEVVDFLLAHPKT